MQYSLIQFKRQLAGKKVAMSDVPSQVSVQMFGHRSGGLRLGQSADAVCLLPPICVIFFMSAGRQPISLPFAANQGHVLAFIYMVKYGGIGTF